MTYREVCDTLTKQAGLDKQALMGPLAFLRKNPRIIQQLWKNKGLDQNFQYLARFAAPIIQDHKRPTRLLTMLNMFAKGKGNVIQSLANKYTKPVDRRLLGRLAAATRNHPNNWLVQQANKLRKQLTGTRDAIKEFTPEGTINKQRLQELIGVPAEYKLPVYDLPKRPSKTRLGDVTRYFQPMNSSWWTAFNIK